MAHPRSRRLDLLTAEERKQLLEVWNRPRRALAESTLPHSFEQQARRTPDALALVSDTQGVSYAALNAAANRLAHLLIAKGIGPEAVIGIALERSIDWIVALFGVVKAGAAYLPLDPDHPPARLTALLEESQPSLVVTSRALRAVLPERFAVLVHDAPDTFALLGNMSDRNPVDAERIRPLRLLNALYIIHTSGSTGVPNAVVITHQGVPSLVAAHIDGLMVTPQARMLQLASFSFDVAFCELSTALLGGATLVIAGAAERQGAELKNALTRHEVTHAGIPPVSLSTLGEPDGVALETLMTGGEACPASLVARWSAGRRMVNAYGPTETTVCATMSAPLGADGAAPLGRPIWNTRVYVLDEALEPVPVGVVGELYVAGPGLARSYGGQPGLTATHFVADPYGAAGTRMYRTGDRARWQPDGVVAFVGRMDAQVKLRGIRVELGEIEAALRADERVQEAVVTVVGEGEQRRLYGYVVPVDGTRADGPALSAALHARLAAQLPAALVPVAIESLAAWPQTRSGKVDRQALPVPTAAAGGPSGGPRTPDEEVLCGLFAEVLQVQQVGLDDDFFARGGHSLLATQLVSRIRATLGGALEIGTVFDAPTVRRLTPQVRGGGPRPALRSGPRPARLPASAGQQRLWFLAQLHGTSTAYHAPAALTLTGALDAAALEAALTALAGRHESLRTHLAEVDGTVVQVIAPPGPVQVRREDLRGLAASVVAARVQAALQEEITTSLPTAGPQWRVRLLQVAAEQHVLLWTVHHLIADGWSAGVLRRDLWALYEAARTGQPAALPPLPVQYADYALWEQAEQMTAAVAASRAYWERQLAGAPAVLALPTAQPRPARPTGTAGLHVTALPPAVSAALARVQAGQQATWHMTLLAALAVVLARASGQPEVVIGTPVAYRPLPVLEDVVGFFVHTLPVRVPVPAAATLRAVLAATRRTLLEAYQHQAVPLEWLVAAGGGPRQVDTPPLVQVVFALEYLAPAVAAPPSLTVAPVAPAHAQVRFDLEVHAAVQGETVTLSWLYRAALFTPVQIAAWAAAYVTLLTAFAEALDPPVRDVLTLAPEERAARLAWGAAPATPPPPASTLPAWFAAQVARTPDAIALVAGVTALSYAALDAQAARLAHVLRQHGVGPEAVVGVALPRSLELLVALLAVVKAGGAYLPLDPAYPAARLAFMTHDARVALVLTSSSASSSIESLNADVTVLRLDGLDVDLRRQPEGDPAIDLRSAHPAYVIYTSGSTGAPKGVVVTHENVVRLFESTRESFDFAASDVWTLFHSCSFDFSVWEIWGAFLHGGRLIVIPHNVSRSPEEFLDLLAQQEVTILNQTPSAFLALARAEEDRPARTGLALRTIVFGGEPLQPGRLASWTRRYLDVPALVNMYGITETTVHVTMAQLDAPAIADNRPTIGSALAHLRVYVLDRRMEPVPRGVTGEIYVGGAGLARGYLGRPALTAARFIADPYGPPGARMYRTGDLACVTAAGNLEFHGRNDGQVKVRGFRIELREVEVALARQARVSEAVAVARKTGPDHTELLAYVVGAPGVRPSGVELREALQRTLPEFMVPAAVIVLDALPLTVNGKVDTAALLAPRFAGLETARPPRTPEEQVFCAAFADVLGLERVGVEDNFFALGGDSIRSIQLRARVKEAGFDLTFEQILQHQTPLELAGAARRVTAPAAGAVLPAFSLIGDGDWARLPTGLADAYPMTRLQEGMFADSEQHRATAVYHDIFGYRVSGDLSLSRLQQAIDRAVASHPTLRTSFDFISCSQPLQLVWQQAEAPCTATDLRTLTHAEQERILNLWLEDEKAHHFDGARPPRRFHVHWLGDHAFHLWISFHHAILDGWSVASLLTELLQAYAGLEPSPPPASTPATFAAAERAAVRSATTREFWKAWLEDAEPTRLAPSRPGPRKPRRMVDVAAPLSDEVMRGLKTTAAMAGVPLKSVLLAAHQRVLARVTGKQDVITGLVTNGRPEDRDGDRALGLFLNTVPLRTQVLPQGTWIELVRAMMEAERALSPHRWFPLVEIRRQSGGLFDAVVNYVHFHAYDALNKTPRVRLLNADGYEATDFKFFVNFSRRESPFRLEVHIRYDSNEYETELIDAIVSIYQDSLQRLATEPYSRYNVLTLAPEERAARLAWGAAPATPPPPASTLPAWFAAQVARTPDAIALVAGVTALSYAALDAQAARLAHVLRQHGVGPEAVVGVALPRSLELLVALLAVVKAGGAYLPLDPAYPAARLAWLMTDAKPACVVMSAATTGPWTGDVPTLVIDAPATQAALRAAPDRCAPVALAPQAAAYVMYTSGSTGTPKGVVVSHAAVVRLVWPPTYATLASDCVLLQLAPLSFDASTFEIWGAWLHGARLVLAAETRLTLTALRHCLQTEGVTTLWLTAGWFHVLVQEAIDALAGLRELLAGGDVLGAADVQRLQTALPHVQVINGYGPTEATTFTCCYAVRPGDGARGAIPLGRPIGGTRVAVLDAQLDPMPRGLAGELYIGGAGLARGYLGQAARTAERFIADPTGPAGARLYRTGDRAQWQPDGTLAFLGRVDDQVKLRGYRVEPGEIAAALEALPGVARAVVVAQHDATTVLHLVGYVVAQPGHLLTPAALREALAARVPDYLVPAAIVVLAALPLTPHGKIDRHALPRAGFSPASEWQAPRTAAECVFCALVSDVLRAERVGIDDDFFQLGGDSIDVIQLVSRARRAGWELQPGDVFEHGTVEALAAIARPLHDIGELEDPGTGEVPLTPIMHWWKERGTCSARFSQSMLLQVPRLGFDRLKQSVAAILAHHDALRLRRHDRPDGDWTLMIDPPDPTIATTAVRRVDARGWQRDQWTTELRAAGRAAVDRLDWHSGRLLDVVWFDAGTHFGRLLLTIHHLAIDAVAWRILLSDLGRAWMMSDSGVPALGTKSASFRRWAHRLAADAQTPARIEELSFWTDTLRNAAPPFQAGVSHASQAADLTPPLCVTLSTDVSRKLLGPAPASFHAGIEDVLLTGLGVAIGQWQVRHDRPRQAFTVDVERHGREQIGGAIDLSNTVGWFTSLFPMRLDPAVIDTRPTSDADLGLAYALNAVKERLRAVPGKGLGYGLLRYSNPKTGAVLAALPQPQVGFNYLGKMGAPSTQTWTLAPEADALDGFATGEPSIYALAVNAFTFDGSDGPTLRAYWSRRPENVTESDLREIADDWKQALEALAHAADRPAPGRLTPSDVPLVSLSQTEIHDLERQLREI